MNLPMSKKLLKYFGFVAIPSCLLIFYLFNTDYRINEFIKQKLSFVPHWGLVETTANHIFNLLDFSKVFYSKPDRHFINLDLSYDDIRSFDQTYRCSSLFLDDRCKSWRK